MAIVAYEMVYTGDFPEPSDIECIPFEERYFPQYMRVYNACFYEMRKSLGIAPYDYLSDYSQIREKRGNIFLLVKDGEIVGSVACLGNEIDDLIVNEKHQHKGYGRQLLLWGLNHIRRQNREPVSLHVAEWNQRAVRLYRDVGFEITRIERICPRNTTGGRSD